MSTSSENIKRWIEQSDIDYITYFIKAWVAFNAWYNNNYSHLNSDREKISAIKSDNNTARNAINTYMEGDSQEAKEFRNYLTLLYYQLQQTQIDGRDGRIWFETILKEKNPINEINNEEKRQNRYYLKREDNSQMGDVKEIKIFIKKKSDNSTIFRYIHTDYDLTHLQSQSSFLDLTSERQENTRLFFQSLEPIKIDTIIENNETNNPLNYYECGSYLLRRDYTNSSCPSIFVCKALVEILYQLRNVLFHGQLVPNQNTQKVYKEAYHILRMMLEKIR